MGFSENQQAHKKQLENLSFFDITNWQDKEIAYSNEFQSVIKSQISQKSFSQDFLNASSRLILDLCPLTRMNCESLIHFKNQPQGTSFFNQLASHTEDLEIKYHFIILSFELQNHIPNSQTTELFLENIESYQQLLKKKNKYDELQRMQSYLRYFLDQYQQGKLKTKKTDWLKTLSLLDSKNDADLKLSAATSIKANSDEFKKKLQQMSENKRSAVQLFNKISESNKNILSILNVDKPNYGVELFLLESVFYNDVSPRTAHQMAVASDLNQDLFFKNLESFYRLRLAYLILLSHLDMKNFLAQSKDHPVHQYFMVAPQFLNSSSFEAKTLAQNLSSVIQLANLMSFNHPAIKKLLLLQKDIKTLITYPQTIMLLFHMFKNGALQDTRLQFPLGLNIASADLGVIIKLLFQGQLPPLLNYHLDGKFLNRFEVMKSFEAIAMFQFLEFLQINRDDFLTVLWDAILSDNIETERISRMQYFKERVENLNAKYASGEYQDLISMCSVLNANAQTTLPSRTINLNELVKSPTLGSLAARVNDAYEGTSSVSTGNVTYINKGYFAPASLHNTMLEKIRLDLNQYIKIFSSLSKLYQSTTGVDKPTLNRLDSRIQNLKNEIKNFILTYNQRISEFENCYFPIMQREMHIMTKVFEYEAQFWKDLATEKEKYQFPFSYSLPQGVSYKTKVNQNNLTTYSFDFLLRMKNYIQFGYKNLPALDPTLNIKLQSDILTDQISKQNEMRSLPLIDDTNAFAKNSLNSKMYQDTVFWYTVSYFPLSHIDQYFDAVALLNRMQFDLKILYGIEKPLRTSYDLFTAPLRAYKLINLSEFEIQNLKALGLSTRYDLALLSQFRIFLISLNEAIPSHESITDKITSPWMAQYGNKSSWENPENRVRRPIDLSPLPQRAIEFYHTLNDDSFDSSSEQDLYSQFKILKDFEKDLKESVQVDFKIAQDLKKELTERMKTHPEMGVNFDTENTLRVPLIKATQLENIDAREINFHKITGGFYRSTSN